MKSTTQRILLWSLFMFPGCFIMAQPTPCDYTLKGTIYDLISGERLLGASVLVESSGRGTASDIDGHFQLSGLCEKEFDLVVSFVGYKTLKHHHDYHHEDIEIFLSPDTEVLDGIIIEGERVGAGTLTSIQSLLSQEQVERFQSESLGEALSVLPGVSFVKTGQNVVSPMIHGLTGNRIVIVNNDVRHEYQNWDADHAPEIDMGNASHLEVVKGAGTVKYGPDAMGGVVVLNPRETELSSELAINFGLTGKTNGKSMEGMFDVSKGLTWMTARAYGSLLRQGDLSAPDYILSNTGKKEHSYGTDLRLHFNSEWDARVSYGFFQQELGILRGAVNGNLEDLITALKADIPNETKPFTYDISSPKQSIGHHVLKTELQYIDATQSAKLSYSFQDNHRREFDVRRGNDLEIPNIDVKLRAHIIEGDWSHPRWNRLKGNIGFQYIYRENANQPGTNTVPFIPNYSSVNFGAYVIENVESGPHKFEAGLRLDFFTSAVAGRQPDNEVYRNEFSYTNLSAILGYKRSINDDISFISNLGTAWRPPGIGELYRFGRRNAFIEYGLWRYTIDDAGGVATGEILSDSERKVSSEIGFKWVNSISVDREKWDMNLTLYGNVIQNYIFSRPAGLTRTVRGTSPFFIYDQQDAFFAGADFNYNREHSNVLNSSFDASYLYAARMEGKGTFAGLPPPTLSYYLTASPAIDFLKSFSLGTGIQYTFKQPLVPAIISVEEILFADQNGIDLFGADSENFDISEAPGGYLMIHLFCTLKTGNFQVDIGVRNLLNTSYRHYTDRMRYFADDMGRNLSVTVRYGL